MRIVRPGEECIGDKSVYMANAWIYIGKPSERNDRNVAKCSKEQRRFRVMSYEKAMEILTRDERFKATIYAMNTLLIHKGIYTQHEFQQLFVEWARKEESRKE